MRVNAKEINSSFLSLIEKPDQIVFLDANFLIPPDRSGLSNSIKIKAYCFEDFKNNWLEPLFVEFSGMAIHESVYDELVDAKIKNFVDKKESQNPSKLKIYFDSELNDKEKSVMQAVVDRLAVHSQYDPARNNAKDRGEILSLSYMVVKGFLYFAAKDELPLRLIMDADRLGTGLNYMGVIQMYELLYYLICNDLLSRENLQGVTTNLFNCY